MFAAAFHRGRGDAWVIVVCHANVIQAFRILLERLSQNQFNAMYNADSPLDRIHNCQVVHYTRQNPADPADVRPHPTWMRSTCPSDEALSRNEWRPIVRGSFTNEDLLREAEAVPRHVADERDGE